MNRSLSTLCVAILLVPFLCMNAGSLCAQSVADSTVTPSDTVGVIGNQQYDENTEVPLPHENDSDDYILMMVEEQPEYPGGTAALKKYLGQNFRYPRQVMEDSIVGKIYIAFVVDLKGRVTDVRIIKGLCEACDAEAIRVIKSMPRWKPGYHKGKPVRVQLNVPIALGLN